MPITPNNLLHLTAIKYPDSLLFFAVVAAGEQGRSAVGGVRVANFRAERVFVMLQEPIDGFDHFTAVNPSELCSACVLSERDSESLGIETLFSFSVAQGERSWEPSEKPKWRAASKGLSAVRGLLAHYDDRIAKGEGSCGGLIPSALPEIAVVLRSLEVVLDKADNYDRKFCLAVKDLA